MVGKEYCMNYNKLEENLTDVIIEAQLKLGYDGRSMSMNYPLGSLNRLLGTNADSSEMKQLLEGFADYVEGRFGRVGYSWHEGDIFRLTVPETGVEYIHGLPADDSREFLAEFIGVVRQPGTTVEDVLSVFRKYSGKVHAEQSDSGEFDWLVYFEDGVPDDHYYCLTDEGICVTYHRFTREDYNDLGF